VPNSVQVPWNWNLNNNLGESLKALQPERELGHPTTNFAIGDGIIVVFEIEMYFSDIRSSEKLVCEPLRLLESVFDCFGVTFAGVPPKSVDNVTSKLLLAFPKKKKNLYDAKNLPQFQIC